MKITKARLAHAVYIPGEKMIRLDAVVSTTQYPGIEMETDVVGIWCSYQGTTFIIPYTIVHCMIVAPKVSNDQEAA